MINSKRKGNNNELALASLFREHGFKVWRDSASGAGNGDKGDLNNDMGFCFEAKCGKSINVWDAWEQVKQSSAMNKNIPVLLLRRDGMPKDEHIVGMHILDWIELVKGEDKRDQTFVDPKAKYAVQRLKDSCREVMKYME